MAATGRALTPQELKEIADHAGRARGTLNLTDPQAPPEAALQAVGDFVERPQAEKRSPLKRLLARGAASPPTATALELGFVWGCQLAPRFGWVWTCVQTEGQGQAYAVVTPDRAVAVYPTHFIQACLDDPRAGCTIMLAFNMLAAGQVTGVPARGYEDLMAGVHRIFPKR